MSRHAAKCKNKIIAMLQQSKLGLGLCVSWECS